ncbi:MAG: F0F1 ATP synthase subunit epsilon [Vicinamibacterales bacterium]|mgnify:CR=1 FL=1
MATITLDIVTPDRQIVHDEVDEVELPGVEGYFGVLPGHTPLLAQLAVGQMWYRQGQERHYLAVEFGFAEVLPTKVTVLAQCAERAEEIDTERAETARKRAEGRLAGGVRPDIDAERARIALMKSLIRLQVASRARIRS